VRGAGGRAVAAVKANPKLAVRVGYGFAFVNAVVSGVSVYVNALGVAHFNNAVVYTTLKNGVSGAVLLVIACLVRSQREKYKRLSVADWGWLLLVAILAGSAGFALYFSGLKLANPVTGSLENHLEFIVVAVLAVALLKERLSASMWAGIGVLTAGVLLSSTLGLLVFNKGTVLMGLSTLIFAAGWVVVKHMLGGRISPMVVMTGELTLGAVLLFAYLAVRGQLGPLGHLDAVQWAYVIGTGLILLVFTATVYAAIRLVRVSAVTAIGTGAPLVTILVDLAANKPVSLANDALGLSLTFVAVVAVLVVGLRQETGQVQVGQSQVGQSQVGPVSLPLAKGASAS